MQGEIMLISITIILLFNFEKTSHTSFCFFETSKLVSPQFLLFTLFCFREKNGEKTLQLTSVNFVYMRLPDLRRVARIAMAHCTREFFSYVMINDDLILYMWIHFIQIYSLIWCNETFLHLIRTISLFFSVLKYCHNVFVVCLILKTESKILIMLDKTPHINEGNCYGSDHF